eukprot:15363767-Alexandrium_andersonii.AAC.1
MNTQTRQSLQRTRQRSCTQERCAMRTHAQDTNGELLVLPLRERIRRPALEALFGGSPGVSSPPEGRDRARNKLFKACL